MRDTAALLLTQDARRPRLGMVPAAAAATASDRHCGRRRRRRLRRRSSRVFEIVEQVVELAVPFGVAAERRRARLQRRHRPCPSVAQDASKEGGGRERDQRQQMCTQGARALAQVFGPGSGDRRIFGADSPTHSLARHTHCTVPSFPSARACVPHITGSLRLSLPPRTVRLLPMARQRSPKLAPGLSLMGRHDRSHHTEVSTATTLFVYINIKGSGQDDKFFSRLGSGRRISGD